GADAAAHVGQRFRLAAGEVQQVEVALAVPAGDVGQRLAVGRPVGVGAGPVAGRELLVAAAVGVGEVQVGGVLAAVGGHDGGGRGVDGLVAVRRRAHVADALDLHHPGGGPAGRRRLTGTGGRGD